MEDPVLPIRRGIGRRTTFLVGVVLITEVIVFEKIEKLLSSESEQWHCNKTSEVWEQGLVH